MIQSDHREQTIRYIRERRCASGGYCFYRLDEPNAADTFYALASLRILGEPLPEDDATLRYLRGFQSGDGSHPNVYVGSAVVKCLLQYGARPRQDPAGWIHEILSREEQKERPMESVSVFEEIMLGAEAGRLLQIALPAGLQEHIIPVLLRHRKNDGGFGSSRPTVLESYHALAALYGLGYDIGQLHIPAFLEQCEDPAFGFLALPGVRPGFLEHLHAGLAMSRMIGHHPLFMDTCEAFIRRCYRGDGGYCRSIYGGSATLEHTWRALECSAILQSMKEGPV